MKQLSLFAMLLCLLAGPARAATLSGTISSVTTCAGVAGQKVYVRDSFSTFTDSAVTNSSGVYSINIPSTVSIPMTLFMTTSSCGTSTSYGAAYTGADVLVNLAVCGNGKGVIGAVMLSDSVYPGPSIIYLIRRDVNPTTMDTTLTAVDSVYSSSFGYFNLRLPCVPTGTYLLKGALMPAHSRYANYLPAYANDSSISWRGATPLTTAQLNNSPIFTTQYTYIHLPMGINPGGTAFIGGSVLLGANKGTAVGDPLAKRILILTNSGTNKPVAYTYSDAAGKFQFSNIAYGTYKLFGDAMGKNNPALTVTVSATQKTINNIVFEESSKAFTGHFNNVSVGGVSGLTGVSVFPNPVADFVQVAGLAAINGSKTILLSSMTGAVISSQIIAQGDATVATSSLPAGIYLLQVRTDAGSAAFRIVK